MQRIFIKMFFFVGFNLTFVHFITNEKICFTTIKQATNDRDLFNIHDKPIVACVNLLLFVCLSLCVCAM